MDIELYIIHPLEERLYNIIGQLLREKYYVDFLVGKNGDFDVLASSTVHHAKNNIRKDNSSLILILPYVTAECEKSKKYFEKYYDGIEICNESAKSYFKEAIQIRIRHMVERSDLIVSYIINDYGGAFQTIRYAEKLNKKIINIADSCM